MHAVVSLLDDVHAQIVRRLWEELREAHRVRYVVERVPFPHVSYHVAQAYDEDALEGTLRAFCAEHEPFTVQTSGLGLFTGVRPILYVAMVRSPALTQFQRALWHAVDSAAEDAVAHFRPANWVPHITLAHDDLTPARLGPIMATLTDRDFRWEFTIDNVALIWDTGEPHELGWRFALGGGEAASSP